MLSKYYLGLYKICPLNQQILQQFERLSCDAENSLQESKTELRLSKSSEDLCGSFCEV